MTTCPHCGCYYIEGALAGHIRHCELRPKPTYDNPVAHSWFDAGKGKCLCAWCLANAHAKVGGVQ